MVTAAMFIIIIGAIVVHIFLCCNCPFLLPSGCVNSCFLLLLDCSVQVASVAVRSNCPDAHRSQLALTLSATVTASAAD